MEKRKAALVKLSKSGNIFDGESAEVTAFIEDYFCTSCTFEDDYSSSEEDESDNESEATPSTIKQNIDHDADTEVDEPVVHVFGNRYADTDVINADCNGQGNNDIQSIGQFSCGCNIKCTAEPGDTRSGCVVQFSPQEILAYNLSIKDMDRAEKDMLILGIITSCMRNGEMTECSHRKSQKVRQKSRSTLTFDGRLVCQQTFLKLLAISANKLRALQAHYKENGLEPRKLKAGGRKNNSNALEPRDIERVVNFIKQYAEDNAVHLPGRVPGFKRDDIQLLPSSTPKMKVYRDYITSAQMAGHDRVVSRTTFGRVWKDYCPYIVVAKPLTDLCWKCQANNRRIFRSANLTDEEKNELLMDQQRHLSQVDAERRHYNDLVRASKEAVQQHNILDLGPTDPNTRDFELHYSFDFAQQVHIPSHYAQPGPLYFLTPRKCAIFGVCCEGLPRQINFLIDEGVNVSKGSVAVISYLHFFFENFGLGERKGQLHCDNCSGQNKNNFLLWYLAWRTMKGLHKEITVSFMPAGHTKFAPDWCFGLLKRKFRRSAVSCLDDMCEVVRESTANSKVNVPVLVGHDDGTVLVPTYDWQGFLAPAFKRLQGLLQYSHFHVSSAHPGAVFFRSSLAEEYQERPLLKSRAALDALPDMPPVLPPPGLSLERQTYLFHHIRQYVDEEKRDVTCPPPRN